MRSTIFFNTLIAALLAPALATPRPTSTTSEATEGSKVLTARQVCVTSIFVSIDFTIVGAPVTNPPFATCTNASRFLWNTSLTPPGYDFCRKDTRACKGDSIAANCLRQGATPSCAPARAYCQMLKGVFAGC